MIDEDDAREADSEEAMEQAASGAAVPDDDSPPDLENRVLCPDGACIGVIGPDGRCKVCGREGEVPKAAAAVAQVAAPRAEVPDEAREQRTAAADDLDLSSRLLCSDGACIGVVGPDGRCKECGKPYAGETTAEGD